MFYFSCKCSQIIINQYHFSPTEDKGLDGGTEIEITEGTTIANVDYAGECLLKGKEKSYFDHTVKFCCNTNRFMCEYTKKGKITQMIHII